MIESEMALKKQIQTVLAEDYRGPKTGFTEVDILKAILAIGNSPIRLGRNKLGRVMGLGQGEVKTLIARLKRSELISVDARGCALTLKGKGEFGTISKSVSYSAQVKAEGLGLGRFAWAVLVRNKGNKVRRGLEQRDAAVRAGTPGALTVVYSAGKFLIPNLEENSKLADCEALGPKEPWTTIRSKAQPRNGDVAIICGADTSLLAEEGALAATLTIL